MDIYFMDIVSSLISLRLLRIFECFLQLTFSCLFWFLTSMIEAFLRNLIILGCLLMIKGGRETKN